MAKINHFIASYSDAISDLDISFEGTETNPPKAVIKRFVRVFKDISDSRVQAMIEYPLVEIILIAFLAVLAGASTWLQIEDFGKTKKKWLNKFIPLKNGIPSHDTFRRVFSLMDTKEIQQATVDFLIQNIQAIKKVLPSPEDSYRHLCVDGKEQRRTGRKYETDEKIRNLQTLHIFDSTNEICIYSEAISEKTNEIPVAQEALGRMNLKGCIVTFDALHTQKKTFEMIRKQKGDYVGGLKGNQAGLLEEATPYFDEEDLLAHYKGKGDYFESIEKAHGQIETRKYYLVRPTKSKTIKEWTGLKAFVCCIKTIEKINTGKVTTEIRYYAASVDDVELCAEAIRGHWGVENKLHWQLDYSMYEDDNTTMDKKAFNNLSLMNKMALTLYKLLKPMMKISSIRGLRKVFGWNYAESLSLLLSCFDETLIAEAMLSAKA